MSPKNDEVQRADRREFLSRVSAVAAGSGLALSNTSQAGEAKSAVSPLPTIKLGEHEITRLVAGWNPIGGYSYMGPNLNRHMKEYFTPERIVEFLLRCEKAGITAHQFSHPEWMGEILNTAREQGSKMKFICLHSAGPKQVSIEDVVKQTRPIAMVHHGGVTDRLFLEGKSSEVHDYVKRAKDAGVLAGVSAHNPDCIKRVADEGWENDFFMNCFYYVTRKHEDEVQMPPVVTVQVGHPFYVSDPATMTEVMRQVEKPCLGFKILAAGRMGFSANTVRDGFKFAFENIKPIDGVIVGMYPRFSDEISQDVEHVRKYGALEKT